MTAQITLNTRLDYQSISPLANELKACQDTDLAIDAGKVRHLGALTMQLLLATAKSRALCGQSTRIINASDACVDQLGLFGYSPESFSQPEAWT